MASLLCNNYSDTGMDIEFFIENSREDNFYVNSQYLASDTDHFISSLIMFLDEDLQERNILSVKDGGVTLIRAGEVYEYPLSEIEEDECLADTFLESLHLALNEIQ